MTVQGTTTRTLVLLFLAVVGAAWSWHVGAVRPETVTGWIWGGLIGGLVFALATIFKKTWAPVTAPLYALAEGLCLGALSMLFNRMYPGIVPQAVGLTFGVMLAMLLAYKARVIRATEKFRTGVVAATGGICLVYFVSIVLNLFGTGVPYIHGAGIIGIGFSVFVVAIAALNLVLDFDLIERGAAAGAPKYMEWYGAFALMVTLVWLYLEILRLLAKLNRR
jgi:uncharacterized YccA/Bax inhibitor family protein